MPIPPPEQPPQTPNLNESLRQHWGWWWKLTLILILGCVACTKTLYDHWNLWPAATTAEAVWWPGISLWILTGIWLFHIVPRLDAAHPNRAWNITPALHLNTLRFILWVPAAMTILSMMFLAFIMPIIHYNEVHRWIWGLRPWMLIFIPILMITAAHAIWLSRLVERRLQNTIRTHQICKSCGYLLHGLTSNRCPECGTPQSR